jgi:thiol-disulfide isomerase/thioredoxin
MFRHEKTISQALLVALWMITLPPLARAELKEGDRLPDLATFKLEGNLPAEIKGRIILLDFWASWCAPCKVSFPAMEALHKKYAERGVTIIAVSVDENREKMEQFLKSVKVDFVTLRDAEQKLVAAFDVPTMPTSFLIDRAGRIRFVHEGFLGDETIRHYNDEIEQLLKEPQP